MKTLCSANGQSGLWNFVKSGLIQVNREKWEKKENNETPTRGSAFSCCVPSHTHPQKEQVFIAGGFLKGKDFLDMDTSEKRAYTMGVINGMLVAPLFGAPEEKVDWLRTCTRKMDDEQIVAILTKYIRDRPADWHFGMNILSFNAMRTSCPK